MGKAKEMIMRKMFAALLALFLTGCVGVPENVEPVGDFDVNRYLGKWYEIARLDHRFERGLNNVTAEYSLRDDGGIRVVNRGFSLSQNQWKQAEGKAFFVGSEDEGHLKVSFFGPFYGSYVIFELDREDYGYAFVTSSRKSYLWLLARTPMVSDDLVRHFIQRAQELGYRTDELIFADHDRP